jgi:tetraacyldisaccharide-1-P 4'-kinase
VVDVPCGDHERYDRAALALARSQCEGADALVITGKDWVKIRRLLNERPWPCPIVVPELRIDFLEGRAALEALVWRSVRREA